MNLARSGEAPVRPAPVQLVPERADQRFADHRSGTAMFTHYQRQDIPRAVACAMAAYGFRAAP